MRIMRKLYGKHVTMDRASQRPGNNIAIPDSMPRVIAVIVTQNRVETLAKSLEMIAAQTRPVAQVVVVDNGANSLVQKLVAECGADAVWIPSARNLGGAGGFALGILHALALGAEWVWLADDDGHPLDGTVLGEMIDVALDQRLDVVGPLVVAEMNTTQLAFPLRRGLRWHKSVQSIGKEGYIIRDFITLFNGALFAATAFDAVGIPDLRLFLRGDEVEIGRRLKRSNLKYGTVTSALYVHPSGSDEYQTILGGLFNAQDPKDPVKRFYTYRNRGYLMRQPGRRAIGYADLLRYSWYFLVTRRDIASFREWARLIRTGHKEVFTPPTFPKFDR
jgi:rhamnopyranosyl-N-acetylglucosaminyl-diphospho-decaprenol beta-1,3/1,4-galactofuranosyltransferase